MSPLRDLQLWFQEKRTRRQIRRNARRAKASMRQAARDAGIPIGKK